MLGLSPPRIFQCRNVKVLDRADSHGKSSRFYRPYLSRGGTFKPPKPLATARVRAAQHSRVASAPRRITEAMRAFLKLCPTDPAEPFAITFAPPREWLRVKDHRPSQDGASPRGLQDAFKHSDPTDDLWSRRVAQCPVACAEMRLHQPYVPRLQRACLTSSQ